MHQVMVLKKMYIKYKQQKIDFIKETCELPFCYEMNAFIFFFLGCGPLPVVNGSKWECPYGVSPLSVPVYESCRVLCKGESLQRRTLVKVRCTEKLEWDHPMLSAVCAVIKNSSGTLKSIYTNLNLNVFLKNQV